MAYFAQLDGNNRVTRIVVSDSLEWLETNLGGWWKPCKKLGNSKLVAVPNAIWSDEHDGFIAPKPFDSWIMTDNLRWTAPVDMPDDGQDYRWDESAGEWVVSE